MRTTTVDTYCTITGDITLHGTISVAIAGLDLDDTHTHTLQLHQIGNSTELASAAAVTVAGGDASAEISLESAELIARMGACRDIDAQLYLWDATDAVLAWNGQIRIRWGIDPA